MGLTRSQILRGPAKIVFGGITYWTPDDIAFDLDPGFVDVASSMFGPKLDALVVNPKVTVTFTPHMFTGTGPAEPTIGAVCAALVPAIFTNGYFGAAYIGSGSEATLVIAASSGEMITLKNAVITKPPSVTFSADKPLFGSMTVTGICATTSSDINLGLANSIYDEATTGGDSAGLAALGVPSYLQRRYKAVLGTQSGFTEMWGESGWTVDFSPSWKERQVQGLTVDFELSGMDIIVKGVPTGVTMDAVIKLLGVGGDNGASWAQGARLSGQQSTHDLTIVEPGASATVFTLKKPVIRQAGFRFGYEALRVGEIGFHSQLRFATGAAQVLAAW